MGKYDREKQNNNRMRATFIRLLYFSWKVKNGVLKQSNRRRELQKIDENALTKKGV